MEKENSVNIERKNSSYNNSEENSCEKVVNFGSSSIIPDEFKRATVFENEKNAEQNLKEESGKGLSLFKKSDKNIADKTISKSNKDTGELDNEQNINQNFKENTDPNKSDTIENAKQQNLEVKKQIIIPAYGSEVNLSPKNENFNDVNLANNTIPSENADNDNIKMIIRENKQINENIDQSEPSANPKPNSKININKPSEETIKESRIKIFKKTDITQGSSYDFIFKIALIGDSGIGKTSILIRFVDDVFKNDTTSTIGVDFKLVSFRIEDKLAKMQIWDTCGSERFKALTSSFIKSCSVFVLVFDLTKQKSFVNLENWIKLIRENVNPKLLCLVGNKADLEDQRQVTLEEAIKFSNKHELKYMETSARTNFGVEGLFSYIAEKLYDDTVRMLDLERKRKTPRIKKKSKGFELGPSSNINKEEDKKRKGSSESESDDENSVDDQQKKKGRKVSLKNGDNAQKRKCNC